MYMSKFDHSGTLRGPLAFFETVTSGNSGAEESDASLTTKAIFSAAVWKKRQILVTKIVKFWRRLDQHVGRGRSSVSRHPIWRICAVFKPYNSPNSAFQKWLKYEVQKQI